MNVLQKKKRIYIQIISAFLSLVFVVCAYVPCIPKVKALSNVTSYNNYGGTTWQIHDLAIDMSGNAVLQSGNISMNLNGHYNGSFTINISLSTIINTNGVGYSNTINNYGFICNGCMITGYDASHLYVSIYDCNYWEIEIVPMTNATLTNPMPILNAFDILSITGWSMTKLDEITPQQITTISNQLLSINSNISTTNSRLTTLQTEVHNIYNAIGSNAQYGSIQSQLYTMGVNLSAEIDQTIAIKNKLDSYLSGTIDNETVSIWDLVNDTNYSLSNIETTLNTINSNINDYTSVLNTISSTLTNIDTNLSNIDNTIDTISWKTFTTPSGIAYNFQAGQTYTNWDGTSAIGFSSTGRIQLRLSSQAYRYSRLYKLTLPMYYYNSAANGGFKVSIENYGGDTNQNIVGFYTVGASEQIVVYFACNASVEAQNIYIIFDSDVKTGSLRRRGDTKLEYIEQTDIEYWQLLQFFNQYEYNKKLLDAINSISVNITQNDITEMNNNITEYNTTMTDINQIENNYINNFTTLDNNIDLTDISTPSVNLVDARNSFNSVFNDLTEDVGIRSLLIMILVSGVLLVLLG